MMKADLSLGNRGEKPGLRNRKMTKGKELKVTL